MDTKKAKKAPKQMKAFEPSISTRLVLFVPSKDHKGMVKDEPLKVSENIADILENKGLGVKQEISK